MTEDTHIREIFTPQHKEIQENSTSLPLHCIPIKKDAMISQASIS